MTVIKWQGPGWYAEGDFGGRYVSYFLSGQRDEYPSTLDRKARSECLAGTQGATTPILACFDEDAGVPIIDEDGKPDIVYPDGMRASWHDAMAKMWDSLAEEAWDAN